METAIWRLRSRGCWTDAAALLAPRAAEPAAALERAALLIERCLYTEKGWADAEEALRAAEAVARTDEERGAAACERGYLAYASTLLGVRDRADEARMALGRAAALIAPAAEGRPLLDFRRGLIAQNLGDSPQAARAAYRRAHAGATAQGDSLLLSFTWRHLAGLALREGSWRRRGTVSPSPCGSARSSATWSARPPPSRRSRTRRRSRRPAACAPRRDASSVCSAGCRPGWGPS